MPLITHFRELNVYQSARTSVAKIFALSCSFPREERFSLTDQVRRSSRAVKSMIAEAWARRRYRAAFISKLTEALGEAMETQSWLDDALDCQCITATDHHLLDAAWQQIGAMLNGMIQAADKFCHKPPD